MAKSDVSIITTELYPIVEKTLAKPESIKDLNLAIGKYFDKYSKEIYDIGIARKVLFLETDKQAVYKASGLIPNEIKQTIKKSDYIKSSWKILNEPLNTASVLILRYLTIKKKEDVLQNFLMFYSFYFYASLHHKYLKFDANENVMEYTINNLTNKYKIKQVGSLFGTILHTVTVSHNTYKEELIRGEDGDFAKYISAIKSRLNDIMKNITNEYMKNSKDKKFLNFDSDDYSEDNFHMADNTSFAIKRLCDSSLMRLMTNGVDIELANLSANLSQVSQSEIRNVIGHLSDEDSSEIERLCELVLQLYLIDSQNKVSDVQGKVFIIKCMEIYKKSNTSDKLIIEIKQILDKWLAKYSSKYTKTNREATLSNFRRAIFIYFVLHIQMSSR